ncbi:MAG: rhamnogalacturonan acetylesterase [Povalibacter sp.]
MTNALARAMAWVLVTPSMAIAFPTLRFERTAEGFAPKAPSQTVNYTLQKLDRSAMFWVEVPEGNYKVTLELTDSTTVKAETRRLMLRDLNTNHRTAHVHSFVVNVRTPALTPPPPNAPGSSAVRLKSRELGQASWDNGLSLEFLPTNKAISAIEIEPVTVPTIYLAGDSTVTDQTDEPGASWGQMLPNFFDASVAVANHAESGETLKSFLAELRLDKILETLHAGDWLLIQFGHNDQKAQWPQTYADASTTYRSYLRAYIAEARRRGATPILITSPERRNFNDAGRIVDTLGDYPEAVRTVAREDSVALIDLHQMSKTFYEALGPDRSRLAFGQQGADRTHHSNYGAYELARMIVLGLQNADPKLSAGLASHLAADAGTFDPAHPDDPVNFSLAASSAWTPALSRSE